MFDPQDDQSQDPPQMPSPAAPQGAPPNLQAMLGQPQAPQPQDPPQMPAPAGGGVNPALQAILGQPAANPVNPIIEQLQQSAQQARERAAARQSFLKQLMTTDALGKYLPKPTAGQMLSDALTNFGMARLTNGDFTPIQLKRYDEAFKRHQADIQNAQTMLQSDRQDELDNSNSLSHYLMAQKQADTVANYHAKITQAQDELARKQKATADTLAYKNARMKLVDLPKGASQGEKDAAQAELARTRATILANGGGNISNAAAAYADANDLDLGTKEGMDEYLKVLGHLKDATYRYNPMSGITSTIKTDSDGNPIQIVASKTGGPARVSQIQMPEGVSLAKFSDRAKDQLKSIKDAYDVGQEIKDILTNTKTADGRALKDIGGQGFWDAAKATASQRLRYQMYVRGMGNNSDPAAALGVAERLQGGGDTGNEILDKLIQVAAMQKLVGARPFAGTSRAFPYQKQIQVHLINEKDDSGSQMYKKVTDLEPIYKDFFKTIKESQMHPGSLSLDAPPPPRSTGGPPKQGAGKPAAVITDPNKINW